MLEFRNLKYKINNKLILDQISAKISKGSFLAVCGPNGSGKTTLSKILSGVIKDYQGILTFHGIYYHQFKAKVLSQMVSMMPQEFDIPFSFSALEIVMMGRYPHQKGMSFDSIEDFQISKKSMIDTDTWQFADRPISSLSGGEKQRVLLARSLAQKTDLLILDEVSSHMDLYHQKDIFELLKKINEKEKKTVIVVMHDLNLALQYCDSFLFLKQGHLLNHCSKKDLNSKMIQDCFDVTAKLKSEEGRLFFHL